MRRNFHIYRARVRLIALRFRSRRSLQNAAMSEKRDGPRTMLEFGEQMRDTRDEYLLMEN